MSRVGAVGEGLRGADVVVDALLGTGRSGEPRGAVAEAIGAIGRAGRPVVAVDVPSGVDASTGEAAAVAVTADVTVTFHAAKLGHVILPGLAHAGDLVVVPIGIPAGAGPEPPAVLAGAARDRGTAGAPGARIEVRRRQRARGRRLAWHDRRDRALLAGRAARRRRDRGRGRAGIAAAGRGGSREWRPMTLACAEADGGLDEPAADVLLERAARAGVVALGPAAGVRRARRRWSGAW